MNALEKWLEDGWHDEAQTMNYLQDNGIVSDNAVTAADVCREDTKNQTKMLTEQPAYWRK